MNTIPKGFISFSEREPADSRCVAKRCVDGIWVALHKPFSKWPEDLFREYEQELYFLFPDEFKTESYNSKDLVCLCSTVTNCPKKKSGQLENRECSEYRRGLCVEASMEANECKPLALGSIARFHGLSKQRVHQIYNAARKRLMLELSHDEVVQEYLAELFMGKRAMPTPEEVAEYIEKILEES